jgi:uncharacterized protein
MMYPRSASLAGKTKLLFSFLFALSFFLSAQQQSTGAEQAAGTKNKKVVAPGFPEATGWVNDFEEVIDSATEAQLTKLIVDHIKKTGNQISIVTISSISPYDYLADYTKDLSNAWGVGEKDKNNGVTIIYSKSLHEVRIATGYGIEKKLSDAACSRIANELMLPAFKAGNYGKGMVDGVQEIIRLLEN